MVTTTLTIRAFSIVALVAVSGWSALQAPQPQKPAANGVRCPAEFTPMWDAATKVLRCRRDVVSWVVTACADKEFTTYVVKAGADACGPTEIPGVGKPPGVRGSRAVTCAASGYELLPDRTGERDRCERIERVFALPLPSR